MSLPPNFNKTESAILIALYEVENGRYSSYSLSEKLHPNIPRLGEEAGAAFEKVRDATEQLIVQGLVSGDRQTGANGVYFEKLRLTTRGEQTAIQVRNKAKLLEKELPGVAKRAQEVVDEIRQSEDK